MNRTTVIAEVEPNHTVKVPADLPVGEKVLIVPLPCITALLNDPERRARFAATRAAVRAAIDAGYPKETLTDAEIVALVKQARRAKPAP